MSAAARRYFADTNRSGDFQVAVALRSSTGARFGRAALAMAT